VLAGLGQVLVVVGGMGRAVESFMVTFCLLLPLQYVPPVLYYVSGSSIVYIVEVVVLDPDAPLLCVILGSH
jgi:hypothetical protein